MELHPFLERGVPPNSGLWYVLSTAGEGPSVRVGHTLTYLPGTDNHSGKLYIIGGANPSGPFSETCILNMGSLTWEPTEHPGLKPRYEHSAFIPSSKPDKIYIFGGADQGSNRNDIQVFDTTTSSWSMLTPGGSPPTPRTYHNATAVGDRFVVYSGGQSGSDPVGDRQVHCYNAKTNAWTILNVRGDSPKPRHGHLVVSDGSKVYVHGGMSGTTFYDDLHILDLERMSWSSVKQKKGHPCGRAAHGGVIVDKQLFIFGGMKRDGALDDLHKLDLVGMKWTPVQMDGPPPACRLDFAMTAVRMRVPVTAPDIQETVLSGMQAQDVLDSQLRIGSAGSVRSLSSFSNPSSAGSQRSLPGGVSPVGSDSSGGAIGPLDLSPTTIPLPLVDCSGTSEARDELEAVGPHKIVTLALVFGGMDTEGEIFDDSLVFVVDEQLESEDVE